MAKTPSFKKLSSHGVPTYVVSTEFDLCSICYFKGFGVARIYVKGVSQCVQCAILGNWGYVKNVTYMLNYLDFKSS